MKKTIFLLLVLLIISTTLVSAKIRVTDNEMNLIIKENNKGKLLAKLDIKGKKLVFQKELFDEDIKYSFYKQKHKGLEVYGNRVGLIEKKGKLVSIKSNYEDINIDIYPKISVEDSKNIVLEHLGLNTELETELIIYKNPFKGPDYLLAYKVKTPFLDDKIEKWLYFIDAETGKIIFRETLLISVSGYVTAQIFSETPTQSQTTVNLSNNNITVWQNGSMIASTLTNNGFYNVTNITGNITIKSNLEGQFVRVLNADQSRAYHEFNTTANQTHSWNWNASDNSDRDEESNMFYHLNIAHDYFTSEDPFNITQMNYQINATVQYGGAVCNAFYDTDSKALFFYAGNGVSCNNTALSADVIYHEYAHAVTYNIYDVFPYYKITGAMSEGYSDYFAATITGNPEIGEGSWNPYIRNVNNTKSYLNSSHYKTCPTGENPTSGNDYCYVHDNSDVFGGALWDLRQQVGNETADALIIRTIKAQPHSFSEFLEDMLIIDDDNADLSDGTPNSTYICQAFANHDIHSKYCNETKHSFDIESVNLSWYDAASNGNIISSSQSTDGVQGLGDDDITKPINLSFEFPFYGNKYSQIFIVSNGLVTLQNYSVDIFRYDCFIPDSNLPNTVIAPLCTDFNPSGGGDVYYWSQTDKFIVEWKNVVPYGQSDEENFELVLFNDGKILMQYLNTTNISTETKIGVEDDLGIAADLLNFTDVNSLAPSAFLFTPTNNPPNITSSNPNSTNVNIIEPNSQSFTISYTDVESDSITIKWYINDVLESENITNWTFAGNYTNSGVYNITVNVSDYLNTTILNWNLTINNTDTSPSINSFYPNSTNITIYENSSQLFNHTSSDVDGDALSYSWLLNGSESANTSSWSYTPNFNSSGIWNLTLVVSDPQNNTATNYWNITVLNLNRAPIWNSLENQTINENETVSYLLNVSDPDSDNVSFWVNNTNINITNETLNYEPDNFTGEFVITISALDNETNTTVFMKITVTTINNLPVFNGTIADQSWNEDTSKSKAFNLNDYFTDADSNLTFNVTGNSNIVVTISDNGNVSFSQPADWFGVENVNFSATDGNNSAVSNEVTLTVNDVAEPSSGGGGGSRGVYIPPKQEVNINVWNRINAGETKKISIAKDDIPIQEIIFKTENAVVSAKITVKKLDEAPKTEKTIKKKIYNYFEISKTNIENKDIKEATISFEVEKSWLKNNSLNREDISLYRYTDDWDELPTFIMRENLTVVFYNSTSPGFSYFSIGEKEKEELIIESEQELVENKTINKTIETAPHSISSETNISEDDKNLINEEITEDEQQELPQSLKFLFMVLIFYLLLGRPKLRLWNKKNS